MKTIAFFNNKGGVGKTSLVYHLAWMYADQGLSVLAADLDPQANLTGMFLDIDRLEDIWTDEEQPKSIYGAILPLLDGSGDIGNPHVEKISDNLFLIPGDLRLSRSEDELNSQWPGCLDKNKRSFRVISAFFRSLTRAAEQCSADIILIDMGPNLGSINRSVLISAESLIIPLVPDIYSLQGLRNLGPTLRRWREEWSERFKRNSYDDVLIPTADITPAGYVVLQHAVRLDRPVKSYQKWVDRIPHEYRKFVLNEELPEKIMVENDQHCLAMLRHYRSLMPMAMEARRPMFYLKPSDGAIGAHGQAVLDCYGDFKQLASKISDSINLVYHE
ncbi:MAG: AAA family ATPase [Gammaproteobacteria bacterium]|nr:AAA family ATPase [Gammaproteobacteria bacterium]